MAVTAIVAGGGIAGIVTALALARSGVSTTVYERAKAREEFGAGLQLTPNATRVLSHLGVLDRIMDVATEPRAVRIVRGSDDAILLRMRVDQSEQRWGAPYLALHRADLLGALVDAAIQNLNLGITYGAELAEVFPSAASVRVVLNRSGSQLEDEADVLIGADGLRSRVRDHLTRRGRGDTLAFTGRVAFRATVDSADVERQWREPEICLHLGPNAHLVHYPLRAGSIVNLVAVVESDWRGADGDHPWDGEADRLTLDRAFAKWSVSTRRLLSSAPRWRAWPLFRKPSIDAFAFDRIALVGDAAHAMEPFLAQGAAQAIEDAGALSSALQRPGDLPSALAAYSRSRVSRATRIQREATRQGQIYHMKGLAALARDAVLRTVGAERLSARYDWLYGA